MTLPFLHLVISLIPLLPFFVYLIKKRRVHASSRHPPSPWKLPVIGNLHQLGTHPHRSLQSLSNRYGELMLLHFGRVPVLIVSSANAAREIMKTQDMFFSNRPKLSIPNKLMYGSRDVAFSSYGEYWRQVRSICVLHLLSNKRVQSFRHVREEETSEMIKKIQDLGSSSVNLSELLASLSNGVICKVALGKKFDGNKFKSLLDELSILLGTSCLGDYIPWLAWVDELRGLNARLEKLAKQFDEFLDGVVEEHRRNRHGKISVVQLSDDDCEDVGVDFVDILLEFQREQEAISPIEDDVIKAIILDMLSGGTHTTSTTLEWTLTELLRHPKAMDKLKAKVREIGSRKEEITEDDLEQMHYLKAVIKESLRLHPPIPLLVPRESIKATKVLGYDIAAGTQVFINSWAIARDPNQWENPEEFCPERFLDDPITRNIDFKGLHFELIPFGAGRRGCPGATFSLSIVEIALAKLVHKFDFLLPNGGKPEDLDVLEVSGISVQRKVPLLLLANTPR